MKIAFLFTVFCLSSISHTFTMGSLGLPTITHHDKKAVGLLLAAEMLEYPLQDRESLLQECESRHGFSNYLPTMLLHDESEPNLNGTKEDAQWSQFLTKLKQKITLADQEEIPKLATSNIYDPIEFLKLESAHCNQILLKKAPSLARLCIRVFCGTGDEKDRLSFYNILLQPRFACYMMQPFGKRFFPSEDEDVQFIASLKRIRELPQEKELLAKNAIYARL